MNWPKLVYEELKKQRKERKVVSRRINKINRKHFVFLKREFFSVNSFDKLDSTKKLLFADETEFENQKFLFEEIDDFYKLRKFFMASFYFFTVKKLIFGKSRVTNALESGLVKDSISKSPKKFLLKSLVFTVSSFAFLNYERSLFEKDIERKITVDSRLGVYLWFESYYRYGFVNANTINFLDEHIQNKIDWIQKDIKSELNEVIVNNLIFYSIIKQHFFNVYVTKTLVDIIVPLMNFENKNNSGSSSQEQNEKYLFNLFIESLDKMWQEKFYSFDSNLHEEKNLRDNGGLAFLKVFFKGIFNNELSANDPNANKDNEKLFLNENSFVTLIGFREQQQIYLNDFLVETLKDFYEEYKKGNIQ